MDGDTQTLVAVMYIFTLIAAVLLTAMHYDYKKFINKHGK